MGEQSLQQKQEEGFGSAVSSRHVLERDSSLMQRQGDEDTGSNQHGKTREDHLRFAAAAAALAAVCIPHGDRSQKTASASSSTTEAHNHGVSRAAAAVASSGSYPASHGLRQEGRQATHEQWQSPGCILREACGASAEHHSSRERGVEQTNVPCVTTPQNGAYRSTCEQQRDMTSTCQDQDIDNHSQQVQLSPAPGFGEDRNSGRSQQFHSRDQSRHQGGGHHRHAELTDREYHRSRGRRQHEYSGSDRSDSRSSFRDRCRDQRADSRDRRCGGVSFHRERARRRVWDYDGGRDHELNDDSYDRDRRLRCRRR